MKVIIVFRQLDVLSTGFRMQALSQRGLTVHYESRFSTGRYGRQRSPPDLELETEIASCDIERNVIFQTLYIFF